MKLIRTPKSENAPATFVFLMQGHEVECLTALLKTYPQLDAAFHRITSGDAAEIKAEQETLEAAMAERRRDHKRKLDKFLASPGRFRQMAPDQFRFVVTPEQMEWLLQILNDVRMGCWVKLGRPELEGARARNLTGEAMRDLAALELSGFFQMVLLEAYNPPPPH